MSASPPATAAAEGCVCVSAQDYWFTADKECVPDGPGFDYTYYNTYTSIVGAFTG